jgi:transcription initiation factor IIF auxiliary subunit
MEYKLINKSSYLRSEGETSWWEWTAYIETPPSGNLDDIEYVEYHLHPSFRNPVIRINTKENGFALTRMGWGTFELKAKLVFKDKNKKSIILSHVLDFASSE